MLKNRLQGKTDLYVQCARDYTNFSFLKSSQANYMNGLKSDPNSFLAATLNVREKAGLIRAYVPDWEKAILQLHQLDPSSAKKGSTKI